MSWVGLRYKGVEVLTPEEWNKVLDALNDLHGRLKGGLATFTGDGVTDTFEVEHGLGAAPSAALAGKGAPGLPDIDYWEADESYIYVTFKSPPEDGASVKVWWIAMK